MTLDPPLLPCPFCGGKAKFEETPAVMSPHPKAAIWGVCCDNAEVDCIGYLMRATYTLKKEAAKAWNTRVQPRKTVNKRRAALLSIKTAHRDFEP